MHSINRRYHKLTKRPTKRSRLCAEKIRRRWAQKQDTHTDCDQTICNNKSSEEISAVEELELKPKDTQPNCVSAAKLNSFPSTSACKEISDKNSYVLMNNEMWSSLLKNIKCEECGMQSLDVVSKGAFGFSSKIELKCNNCLKIFNTVFTSPREKESKGFEASKKLVEAFLKIGKGHAALEVFCMAIGIHAMDKTTFAKCLQKLYEEKQIFKDNMLEISRKIVREKHQEFGEQKNEIIDIIVSYDGTWQKRGHTSLYGIGIVIDILTGLVIDYEVLSKYCPECVSAKRDLSENSADFSIWFEGHKPECSANFIGSSNSMEMKAAEILWKRSVNACGMRYVSILSDGDAKTYQHLLSMNVYGEQIKISKEECINHVAKRLGTGLRNKVTEWRSKGVTIGGRKEGSLKEDTITKLTNFYRKDIKDNIPDVQKMKSAIYASLFHCSSTNKSPKHNKCPTGSTSWCFYQRALANSEKPKSHTLMKTKLSEDILAKILPIYQRLASNELLVRCAAGKTQNTNESLHSVIWKNCPKEVFVSKKRLEIAVASSVSEFNFGCFNSLNDEQDTNLLSVSIAQRRDKRRIDQSQKRNSETGNDKEPVKKLLNRSKLSKM